VEEILRQAEQLEKDYDWLGAAESCKKALNLLPQDEFLKMGEIQERVGFCLYRAAMQAEAKEEFQQKMRNAVESYKKACDIYQKLAGEQEARVFRTIAIAKYLDHWLASSPSEKRTLLSDCLDFADKALSGFSKSGDIQEYTKTYNALSPESSIFFQRAMYEGNNRIIKKVAEQGMRWGETVIAAYSEPEKSYKAALAYLTMSICLLLLVWYTITDPQKQEQMIEKAIRYTNKAVDLSEKSGDALLSGYAHFWLGFNVSEEESIKQFEKTLECTEKTRDMFMKAVTLDFLAYTTYWKAIETEDPDKRRQLAEKAMELYDKSQRLYSVFSYMSPRGGLIPPPGGYAEHYLYLSDWETDQTKKQEYLRKSESIGLEAFKVAEESGVPVTVDFMLHILSRISVAKARLESDSDEKRRILEKALGYTQRCINMYETWKPGAHRNIGAMYNELADIKAEIAYLEADPNAERKLLEEAASDKEKCLELMTAVEKRGIAVPYTSIYGYQDTYWTLLGRLFKLTNNPEHMRRAIEVTQNAMETAVKLDMVSLIAESYWKIASAQENLQECLAAADNFQHASENYLKAAEKIPRLERLYQDHASYMLAWSEIEKARHHHARQEYNVAKGHYESAAKIHESLKKWNYLAPNYWAWAQIEQAEDLSGKEQNVQAIQAFEQAAKMFKENKQSFQAALSDIENPNEKQMVAGLIQAANHRKEYCMGRIAIEEAKIQDKKGDHHTSSEKYLSAAKNFQQLAQSADSEEERKELRLIAVLSKAWQKMAQAEAEASPRFYVEAAQLFEEAKELSSNERAKMLALGHSRFCRALEVGTNFADTMETTLHAAAAKHLESAANFYAKAGCQNASEYAKATGFLLDAYLHIDNAKKETDPEKKARLYGITEKILQATASSYLKSEHQDKREQVLRLLENIKDEKELALSLVKVLHAPSIISTTTVFSSPSSLLENAVGLEMFENAEIQTNVLARKRELQIGDELNLEIELVNAGKGPASLVKLAEVIPESFELVEKPETCRQEDSYLNMKGRRLDPLKTEEIKLVFKPKAKGVFSFKPRILYLDENGKLKSNEPEPIEITVKELGIRSWIKGGR
jgi:hypothetical protein